jgi:hypothetical protein
VSSVLCRKLPEVATTVAVYVPKGVPWVVWDGGEFPRPHPMNDTKAKSTRDFRMADDSRGLRKDGTAKANMITIDAYNRAACGDLGRLTIPAVVGAVVPKVICTDVGCPSVT